MRKYKSWAVLLAVTAVSVAGCGASTDYANDPRPPQLVTITSAIAGGHVRVSPSALGAGPAMLVVANETDTSQQLTISRPAPNPLDLQTGPINPGDNATLQVDLYEGTYVARTGNRDIAAAQIVVGASRPSSQNAVQLP